LHKPKISPSPFQLWSTFSTLLTIDVDVITTFFKATEALVVLPAYKEMRKQEAERKQKVLHSSVMPHFQTRTVVMVKHELHDSLKLLIQVVVQLTPRKHCPDGMMMGSLCSNIEHG